VTGVQTCALPICPCHIEMGPIRQAEKWLEHYRAICEERFQKLDGLLADFQQTDKHEATREKRASTKKKASGKKGVGNRKATPKKSAGKNTPAKKKGAGKRKGSGR